MTAERTHGPPVLPVVAPSVWGYAALFIAWNMADGPRAWSYLQLAVPFTVALVGLPTDSRRW